MHSCLIYDPVGRPPEAAWGALQKLRHSVRSHPLKGVEPELYSPEELLGGSRRPPQASSFRPPVGGQAPSPQQLPLQNGDAEVTDQQPSTSWFQLPWRISQQDDAPSSRRVSGHDRGYPLNQPPMVSVSFIHHSCCYQASYMVNIEQMPGTWQQVSLSYIIVALHDSDFHQKH